MTESSVKIWTMILGQYQVMSLKFMLAFFFMAHLSGYDKIFETEK